MTSFQVETRFVRLFSVFNVAFPPAASIRSIYSQILTQRFHAGAFDKSLQGGDLAAKVTSVTMDVFNAVVAALPWPAGSSFAHRVAAFRERDMPCFTRDQTAPTPAGNFTCRTTHPPTRSPPRRSRPPRRAAGSSRASPSEPQPAGCAGRPCALARSA